MSLTVSTYKVLNHLNIAGSSIFIKSYLGWLSLNQDDHVFFSPRKVVSFIFVPNFTLICLRNSKNLDTSYSLSCKSHAALKPNL